MRRALPCLVWALASCAPLRLPPVIDAHAHTDFDGEPERSSGIKFTLENFLKGMKDAGVVGAVSHNAYDGAGDMDLRNQGVVHCSTPGEPPDAKALEPGLQSGRHGCIKIYLGYTHRYAYDPVYKPIYELARRHGVPVVFHTGDTYSQSAKLKYSHPLTIDEVAVDHPETTFVIAHMGNPWVESAAEVAYKNPNVYLEGSAFLIGDFSRFGPEAIEEYMIKPLSWAYGYIENSKKLLFGTDWPLVSQKAYRDAFARAIPPEAWNDVFHDNAVRVFKIPGRKLLSESVTENQ